jgi:protoporphyrinogen oxidase
MSEELIRYLETQDESVGAMFVQNVGDELTDILVAALAEALEVLAAENGSSTVH